MTHNPLVYDGQAGGVFEGLYAAMDTPLGLSVAHWLLRFSKSGEIGVGVPWRV